MPIVRVGTQLVYFAHIPKCAGSSVEDYLRDRFGPLALLDRQYLSVPEPARWSRTSPQHVDWASLERFFPAAFFADIFAVVRHPLDRAVSAFRFQSEVEGTVPAGTGFGDWLRAEAEAWTAEPHRSDNHSRPQCDFLPPEDGPGCAVFHLEHGLDALIPYFDALAGNETGPRAMSHANRAAPAGTARIEPTEAERALVAELYAADFARFGYSPDRRTPLAEAPELSAEFMARNAAARARAGRPLNRLATRVWRRVRRML